MFVKQMARFILGSMQDAMRKLRSTLPVVTFSSPLAKQGQRRGGGDGTFAGGVAWPVDHTQHDGLGFITADSFPAEYIAADNAVYLLDRVNPNVRHPGADPLKVGTNVFLPKPLAADATGHVSRTAEFGTEGLDQNVFYAHSPTFDGTVDLIAHHRQPRPNRSSTKVYDPSVGSGAAPVIGGQGQQGTQIVNGPIDDQWRVGGFNPALRPYTNECPNKTVPTVNYPTHDGKNFGVYWNCGSSGGDPIRGHGLAWFDGTGQYYGLKARLGYGMNGPLRPASELHKQFEAIDGPLHAGALDLNTYWTWGAPQFDGPLDFEQVFEPEVIDQAGVPHRVHLQMDPDVCHPSIYGPRPGKWRWHVKLPIVQTPPCTPSKPPEDPVQYAFDMGGRFPPPTYYMGYLMGAGISGLAVPGWNKRAQ